MKKIVTVAILIALVGYTCFVSFGYYCLVNHKFEKNKIQHEEEIFPVIGRATLTIDMIGSTVGFVIKDGDRFKIARYDKGSFFDNENFQPKFLSRYKTPNGEIQYQPFVVTEYK